MAFSERRNVIGVDADGHTLLAVAVIDVKFSLRLLGDVTCVLTRTRRRIQTRLQGLSGRARIPQSEPASSSGQDRRMPWLNHLHERNASVVRPVEGGFGVVVAITHLSGFPDRSRRVGRPSQPVPNRASDSWSTMRTASPRTATALAGLASDRLVPGV